MASFNLQHLKYFHDTIRLGGVSQAAKENHVSQSTVSQGILKLEQCFGKSLLEHKRNRIQLTEEGDRILKNAGDVLKAVDVLEESIHQKEGEYCGQVTLGCTHSLAQSLLGNLIHQLNQEVPKVKLKLRFGHTGLVKQWLSEGSIDFGMHWITRIYLHTKRICCTKARSNYFKILYFLAQLLLRQYLPNLARR